MNLDEAVSWYAEETDARARAEAFDSLLGPLQAYLLPVIRRTCWSGDDIKDALQETLLKVATNIESLQEPKKLKAWARQIAINTAQNFNRARSRRQKRFVLLGDISEKRIMARAGEATLSDEARERIEQLMKAIELLPPSEQQLLDLWLDGLSAAQIAEITGYTRGSVATLISRYKQRLENILEGNRKA